MKKLLKKQKGFTLVELLVVIAILGILATVSVVGYTTYIKSARESNAKTELTEFRDMLIAEDINNDKFTITDTEIKFAFKEGSTTEYYTFKDILTDMEDNISHFKDSTSSTGWKLSLSTDNKTVKYEYTSEVTSYWTVGSDVTITAPTGKSY